MKKPSNLSQFMGYAGSYRDLTCLSLLLSAVSAGLASMISGLFAGIAYLSIPAVSAAVDEVFGGPALPVALLVAVVCVVVTLCTKREELSEEELLSIVLDGRTDL